MGSETECIHGILTTSDGWKPGEDREQTEDQSNPVKIETVRMETVKTDTTPGSVCQRLNGLGESSWLFRNSSLFWMPFLECRYM